MKSLILTIFLFSPLASADLLSNLNINESFLTKSGYTKQSLIEAIDNIECIGTQCTYNLTSGINNRELQSEVCRAAFNDDLCMEIRRDKYDSGGNKKSDELNDGYIRSSNISGRSIVFYHQNPKALLKLKAYIILLDKNPIVEKRQKIALFVKVHALTHEGRKNFSFGIDGYSGGQNNVSNGINTASSGWLTGFLGNFGGDALRAQLQLAANRNEAAVVQDYSALKSIGDSFDFSDTYPLFRDNSFGDPQIEQVGLSFHGRIMQNKIGTDELILEEFCFNMGTDARDEGSLVRKVKDCVRDMNLKANKPLFLYGFDGSVKMWEKQSGLLSKRYKANTKIINIIEFMPLLINEESTSQLQELAPLKNSLILQKVNKETAMVRLNNASLSNKYDKVIVNLSLNGKSETIYASLSQLATIGVEVKIPKHKRRKSYEAKLSIKSYADVSAGTFDLNRGGTTIGNFSSSFIYNRKSGFILND